MGHLSTGGAVSASSALSRSRISGLRKSSSSSSSAPARIRHRDDAAAMACLRVIEVSSEESTKIPGRRDAHSSQTSALVDRGTFFTIMLLPGPGIAWMCAPKFCELSLQTSRCSNKAWKVCGRLCGNQNFTARSESSRRPPRHRRDACSMACTRPLVDFHTGHDVDPPSPRRRRAARRYRAVALAQVGERCGSQIPA